MTASGSIDESWFYLVSLIIESKSGKILCLILDMQEAAAQAQLEALGAGLHLLAEFIDEIAAILTRMYEENIPAVFYQRVRRFLMGWLNDDELPRGLFYGDEAEPRKYAGGSAGQSPLVQAIDIALGVCHHGKADRCDTGFSSASDYLLELRQYMHASHRRALEWLEANLSIRKVVVENQSNVQLRSAYQACLGALRRMRDKHLQIVATYIVAQARRGGGDSGGLHGTGGSNPVPFLKQIRSHIDEASLRC